MRLNAKTCKALRKEALYSLPRGRFPGSQAHYAERQYKQVHEKEPQVNPATGKPYRERDTGRPILLDVVRTVALPIRLSDGSARAEYRTLKKLHAARKAEEARP